MSKIPAEAIEAATAWAIERFRVPSDYTLTVEGMRNTAQGLITAALPALRAALAEQVEAAGREEVQWLADHAQDDARDRARLIGAEEAWQSALRIIRGAS